MLVFIWPECLYLQIWLCFLNVYSRIDFITALLLCLFCCFFFPQFEQSVPRYGWEHAGKVHRVLQSDQSGGHLQCHCVHAYRTWPGTIITMSDLHHTIESIQLPSTVVCGNKHVFSSLCCNPWSFMSYSGAKVDRRLEFKHRQKTHSAQAGVWGAGRLQEEVHCTHIYFIRSRD